jgi:hypothetical protein
MKVLLTTVASPLIVVAAWVGVGVAQGPTCPPEVALAKAMLTARGGDMMASCSQDVQAPRSQATQAGRSQDVQSPRSQDTQAPRSDDVQSPRSTAGSVSVTRQAQTLVMEAEAACQAGNTAAASQKARAALEIMKH